LTTPLAEPLAGKVAIVTGGSRGIGAAIVRRLARDGAAVAFTYGNAKTQADALVAEIVAAGGSARAIRADSADEHAVRAAVDEAADAFGRLDVFVNNAGILELDGIETYPLATFDRMVAVNVRALFVGAQAAARRISAGGRIIAIGSIVSDRAGFPTTSVYAMTKGAVAGLVRGMARDLGPRGITVNNVQPGPTDTDMNPGDGPGVGALTSTMALGRLGHPDEIASLVSYVASPEASFITGASLTVDGGYTA
jgi:3-oxoacyl-[acyl-carrier protein] reductase